MAADGNRVLDESRIAEGMVLDIHRIWEFFRAKLGQRYVAWFRPALIAADEFAWACYQPARNAASPEHAPADRVKEPPLVFFNGGWSPFTMSRGAPYEPEPVGDNGIRTEEFRVVLQDLPIPVIGIPWYQVQHLPGAVVLGHEVGHNVEDDFSVTGTLEALLGAALAKKQVPIERRNAWYAWAGEVFGDVYGVLGCGPAFVGAFMDFAARSPVVLMIEEQVAPDWELHPPDGLRALINLATLEHCGFSDEAAELRSRWTARFPRHAMGAFEHETEEVVSAFLEGPYPELGGKALTEVLSFSRADQNAAVETAERILQGREPLRGAIRPLLAGAYLAFARNPKLYEDKQAQSLVLDKIEQTQTRFVRGGSNAPALDARDRADGHELFERMLLLRSRPADEDSHQAATEADREGDDG